MPSEIREGSSSGGGQQAPLKTAAPASPFFVPLDLGVKAGPPIPARHPISTGWVPGLAQLTCACVTRAWVPCFFFSLINLVTLPEVSRDKLCTLRDVPDELIQQAPSPAGMATTSSCAAINSAGFPRNG
ncbi:MAG: hypothetical protein R3C04_01850 [Hyphomonas sp.]